MKVYIAYNSEINDICIAESYKAAVNHLFAFHWINPKDEIRIDGQMTTLEEYFGKDCVDMITNEWDIEDFNEFWDGDYWISEREVIK